MDYVNNKTSLVVSSQVPEFVRRDHPKFIEFLEAYYKFLEQDGETLYTSKRFGDFYNIDSINEDINKDIKESLETFRTKVQPSTNNSFTVDMSKIRLSKDII